MESRLCGKKSKVRPTTGHKAQGGGVKVYLSSFFILSARWEYKVNATPRPLHPWEREPVPIVQEAGWAPEPVWTGAENLATIRLIG